MLFKSAPKIAAVVYVLWGLIHIAGGAAMLNASSQSADAFVQMLSGNANATLAA